MHTKHQIMKNTRAILFVFLLIAISACGQQSQNVTQDDWKTLEENDFSIQYPNEWSLNLSGMMGTSFILFSELTSEEDKFGENINLIIQNLEGQSIDLQKYVEKSEEQVNTLITNSSITESKSITSNGSKFHSIIYSGDQGAYNLIYKQYFWVENELAYILTLTCEADQFENYKIIGEQIMNSFKIN